MILASDLQDVGCATEYGGDSRLFYRNHPLPLKKAAEEHARKLGGAEHFRMDGEPRQWELKFVYEGYRFQIENDVPDGICYFAVDRGDCPDEILLTVLRHWEKQIGKGEAALAGGTVVGSGVVMRSGGVPGVVVRPAVRIEDGRPAPPIAAGGTTTIGIVAALLTALGIAAGVWFRMAQVGDRLNGGAPAAGFPLPGAHFQRP